MLKENEFCLSLQAALIATQLLFLLLFLFQCHWWSLFFEILRLMRLFTVHKQNNNNILKLKQGLFFIQHIYIGR